MLLILCLTKQIRPFLSFQINFEMAARVPRTITTELINHMKEIEVVWNTMSKEEQEKSEEKILNSGGDEADTFRFFLRWVTIPTYNTRVGHVQKWENSFARGKSQQSRKPVDREKIKDAKEREAEKNRERARKNREKDRARKIVSTTNSINIYNTI